MNTAGSRETTQANGIPAPLEGLTVLVTRPAHQAEGFCRLVEAAGGRTLRFPALEIQPPADPAALDAIIDGLDDFQIAIFISPNAVHRATQRIQARRGALPPDLKLATVGRKTAQALERRGYRADICPPERFDSESLLAQPQLQDVAGQTVVIFRGEGGRELLGATLTARGAKVTYAEAYHRGRPDADPGPVLRQCSQGGDHVITITSSEALRNLFDMLGEAGRSWLRCTPLVVGCDRMVDTAREMGFKQTPVVADDPSDEAMLEAVQKWAEKRKQTHE
ncbi:MAG: uroporphyrinogen-III synthase [Ectothiorhodospira sp.]